MRDMTKKQFDAACGRYGFEPCGFLGYYSIGGGKQVSIYNAGKTRREQLAYLIREQNNRFKKRAESAQAKESSGEKTMSGKLKWNTFDRDKGYRQKRPPVGKFVVIAIKPHDPRGVIACVVGYMKNAAGCKDSPYFVRHGCTIEGDVIAWCDCIPEDFEEIWKDIHAKHSVR